LYKHEKLFEPTKNERERESEREREREKINRVKENETMIANDSQVASRREKKPTKP
jgi:hypothetical protein